MGAVKKPRGHNDGTGRSWTVYGLIDPRTGFVFYVGLTTDLPKRIRAHHTNAHSPARGMCRDIEADGLRVGHCIFGEFASEHMAAFLERELIVLLPQLYNETGFTEGSKMWGTVQRVFR